MKRVDFLRYLRENGCVFIREGGSHSWWGNSFSGKRSSIPRHTEINDYLMKKICKDLGIPPAK